MSNVVNETALNDAPEDGLSKTVDQAAEDTASGESRKTVGKH